MSILDNEGHDPNGLGNTIERVANAIAAAFCHHWREQLATSGITTDFVNGGAAWTQEAKAALAALEGEDSILNIALDALISASNAMGDGQPFGHIAAGIETAIKKTNARRRSSASGSKGEVVEELNAVVKELLSEADNLSPSKDVHPAGAMRKWAKRLKATIRSLAQPNDKTRGELVGEAIAALKDLHADCVEYARINNLHNSDGSPATHHSMRRAEAAIRALDDKTRATT